MAVTILGGYGEGSATASTNIEVEEATTVIAAANNSRYGIEIVNESTGKVWLALGKSAESKKGMFLAPSGGSWDGRVSGITWRGSINGIASAAKSIVTVTEL